MLPDGLKYVGLWRTEDGKRCFQLMETENPEVFNLWIEKWIDQDPNGRESVTQFLLKIVP